MRCISFCVKQHYDEGILKSSYPLPGRNKIIEDIKSNAGFHGSIVEMRTNKRVKCWVRLEVNIKNKETKC
jgi:hypothetical protein